MPKVLNPFVLVFGEKKKKTEIKLFEKFRFSIYRGSYIT